jgi:hypothetical protein
MIFNHLESPEEREEPEDLEGIIEIELIFEHEKPVQMFHDYDVPQDNYLEQELERQKQEELARKLPIRIP